tara:strand:- start:9530 stop:9709 length:180 start_codon:yes stop_codon:yes gene_type:complete
MKKLSKQEQEQVEKIKILLINKRVKDKIRNYLNYHYLYGTKEAKAKRAEKIRLLRAINN